MSLYDIIQHMKYIWKSSKIKDLHMQLIVYHYGTLQMKLTVFSLFNFYPQYCFTQHCPKLNKTNFFLNIAAYRFNFRFILFQSNSMVNIILSV